MDRNCKTCEFAMLGNGILVCAGVSEWYGIPIEECLKRLGNDDCGAYEQSFRDYQKLELESEG